MAAARILSRSLLSKLNRPPRLRALSAVSSVSTTHSPSSAFASRFLSTRTASSSLKDSNPNWSNRPPKETILLDGCDFEHWLVVVEKPEGDPTRDEIIDSYVKTLAMVVGSEEEARMKLYSVSTRHYFAFGCLVSEELSYKIKELPRVCWVLPDSYLHVQTKDYGGEPVINGVPVPYDPKYHEEWVKNHNHARDRNDRNNNRTRRRDNNIQSRNFPRNVPMTNTQSSVGGPQNNMSGPHSHTGGPPQNTGGTPPYTGGYQPNNAGGYKPNHAGGYQPNHAGGYQPNHTGGYQPNNRGGFPPNNAGEMPPNNTGGYQTNNIGSFQQNNMGGMPPNNANQPPRDMGGYQSNNTGVIPQNNMGGLQPSNMGAMPNNAASQPNREYSNQGPYMNSSPSNRDFQNDYSQSNRGIPSGGNTHQQ